MLNFERINKLAPLASSLLALGGREGPLAVYPHLNADGDALGASLGLTLVLEAAGVSAVCVLNEPIGKDFSFLPRQDKFLVWPELPEAARAELLKTQQAALMIDVSVPERLAERRQAYEACPRRFILDHHLSEKANDKSNFIFPDAAASCELGLELALALEKAAGRELLSRDAALGLYAGLLTDTGNFSYANVKPSTLAAAAKLLTYGVDLPALTDRLFRAISWTRFKFEGVLRGETREAAGGRIKYLLVPRALLEKHGAEDADVEGMPSLLRDIEGTEISLVLRETAAGTLRGNLRSEARVDVSRAAAMFGGGGHKNAAGFTITGLSLEEALPRVLKTLEEALPDGR